MDFGMSDIVLLTTMSLAVVVMSLTFPALGMTDDGDMTNESDIPEFNISSDEWNIAGDFPDSPGTPTSGEVVYDEQVGSGVEGRSLIWLQRGAPGQSLEMQNLSNQLTIRVNSWDGDPPQIVGRDEYDITSENQTILHQNASMGWTIEMEVTELENAQQSNMTATVEYEVLDSPDEGGGGLSAIPIIGSLFSAGEQLASGLIWIGQVIWWLVAFLVEIALTIVLILVDIMVFAASLMQWLVTTYFDVVSAAGSFAGPLLMIPGILLFVEFAKLGMLGIKLLPTT